MGRKRGVKRESVIDGKSTVCKCPRCGKMHKLFMNFTGRGVPRCYCYECKFYFTECNIDDGLIGTEYGPRAVGYAAMPPPVSEWALTPVTVPPVK